MYPKRIKIANFTPSGKGGAEVVASQIHQHLSETFNIKTIEGDKLSIQDMIREFLGADVIITHKNSFIKKFLPALFVKRNRKIIMFQHFSLTKSKKKDIYHKIIYSKVDLFIPMCKSIEQRIKENWSIPPEKIKTIYPGVDTEKFFPSEIIRYKKRKELGIKTEDIVLGVIAKITEKKNQEIILKAVCELPSKFKERIKILLVGNVEDQKYYEKMMRYIREFNLENSVIFQNFTDRINDFYNTCDSAVITSKEEAFGLVALEALATEKFLIAPKDAGVSEILEDKKDSLIYKTNNLKDLSEKIKTFLEMGKDEKERMIRYGKEKIISNFSVKRFIEDVKNTIFEIL
ncbi:D-inositol 3-phosphate glycosyltransferase [bacterium HR19]|nr:D-inositol 3-phosphate glycosyltransferase [bacterium HR19]